MPYFYHIPLASTLVNTGILRASGGGTLDVEALDNQNVADVDVNASSTLTLRDSWSNSATLEILGGTLNLGGTFNDLGTFTRAGGAGTVNLTGIFTNAGTFTFDDDVGVVRFSGSTGEIIGGTLLQSGAGDLQVPGGQTGRLDGVTLGLDLDVATNGNLILENGLTFSGGAAVTLENTSAIQFADLVVVGTQTLGGTGEVRFGGTNNRNRIFQSGTTTWTVGPNVTIGGTSSTEGGTIGSFEQINNQGLIEAAVSGETIFINATTVTNTGTLQATNGGEVDMSPGSFPTNAGTITIGADSTVDTSTTALINTGILEIAGTLDLNGQTLTNSNILRPGTSPGTSPGITTIEGDLILDSNSMVEVDLAGTDPLPPDFDIINANGSATIDGTLDIIHFGGFTPTLGDTFEIITAVGGTSGQFATLNPPGGFIYDQVTAANELTLLFTNGAVF